MSRKNLFQKAVVLSSTFLLIVFFLKVLPINADEYPTRPVKIILPFGPGGVQASSGVRLTRDEQPTLVVIENKPYEGELVLELGQTLRWLRLVYLIPASSKFSGL
jgi:hypothetical protein